MVEVQVPGIWKNISTKFKKHAEEYHIFIEPSPSENRVYCFIGYGSNSVEYEKTDVENPEEVSRDIMMRESHGEEIDDILEEKGFQRLFSVSIIVTENQGEKASP